MADDTVFNIWYDLPLGKLVNPEEIIDEKYWWRPIDIRRSYDLFENKYKKHPEFGKSWREYNKAVSVFISLVTRSLAQKSVSQEERDRPLSQRNKEDSGRLVSALSILKGFFQHLHTVDYPGIHWKSYGSHGRS